MPVLQQNVSTSIPAGPFVYSTDGFTVNGSITATNLTVNLYKNGAVSTYVPTTANWSTAIARGCFLWTLTTDAVDTIGNWTAYLYTTNCLPVREDYVVRSSNLEDFVTGSSAPATPTGVWAHTSRDLSTYAGLSSAVWQETTRALTTAGAVWTVSSRDLSTYAGLSAAVWGYTTRNLSSFGVTLGADVWSVTTRLLSSAATISSAVWAATTRTLTSYGGASTASLAQITTGVWAEASRTLTSWGGASTASVAQITTAVWAETVRSLTSFGHSSAVWSYTSRDLSTYAGLSSAVWSETTRTITSFPSSLGVATTVTEASIWQYSTRSLTTYGGLSTVATTFTLDQITSGVWSHDISTYATTGTAGRSLGYLASNIIRYGTAAGGSSGYITLDAAASTVDNFYKGGVVTIVSGTGAGQCKRIATYGGASKNASVAYTENWETFPTTDSVFCITPGEGSANVVEIQDEIISETVFTSDAYGAITSDVMNRVYDGSLTFVQGQRLMTGVLLGNSTGGGTTAISFQNFGTTGARVSYTVTTAGNRAITTYSLTS